MMLFILIGFLSGMISGMGLGGGTLLIPMLTIFAGVEQKAAQGANLVAFIPAAIIALFSHVKKEHFDFKQIKILWIYGIIGTAAGFLCAFALDTKVLRKGFGGFLLVLGIWQFIQQEKRNKSKK